MTRRQQLVFGAVVAGAIAAAILWLIQQRHHNVTSTPAWTDPEQPPEGIAGAAVSIGLPPAMASWTAARPGDPGLRSGSRIMRSYAPSLTDDPNSVVR